MDTIEYILLFGLLLNAVLFILQVSAENVGADTELYDISNSPLLDFDSGNYTIDKDYSGLLPESEQSVSSDDQNWFSDIFSSLKNWILNVPGARYVALAVTAIPNFLNDIGLPPAIAFALGTVWYAFGIFLFITWIKQ